MTKHKKIHTKASLLDLTPDDIRWGTPEVVAEYRARRLQCSVIADLCSGVGFQSFAFAKYCTKVYAVENDKEKVDRARKNAKVLGIQNIEFIQGNVLSDDVIHRLKNVDIVFCDPERLASEEERTVKSITPDITVVLDVYGKLTQNIAIEFPSQIQEVPFDCEREYVSVAGCLNRLTLYFGSLTKCERSAVVLPSGEVLSSKGQTVLVETNALDSFLYEVDPAVAKAELVSELTALTGAACFERGKAVYCTSGEIVKSPFFKNTWRVLDTVHFNQEGIIQRLKRIKAGKVVLRFSVDPREYGKIRKGFERELKGDKIVHLFKFGNDAVVGERI